MLAKISFEKPDEASLEDIAEFIDDALSSMGGCRNPEDPLFHSLKLKLIEVHGKKFKPRD